MEAKKRRCEKQSFKIGNASKGGFLQRDLVSSNRQLCVDSDDGGGGGSSSSFSDLDNKNQQGSSNSCEDERSPKFMTGCSSNGGRRANEENAIKTETQVRREDSMANGLFDMPCVFTKGDGPNGRQVNGILYKYGKGKEVTIICICHGTFLTPAEFVKHGGGRDVDRPLRHIVVNTSSSTF